MPTGEPGVNSKFVAERSEAHPAAADEDRGKAGDKRAKQDADAGEGCQNITRKTAEKEVCRHVNSIRHTTQVTKSKQVKERRSLIEAHTQQLYMKQSNPPPANMKNACLFFLSSSGRVIFSILLESASHFHL